MVTPTISFNNFTTNYFNKLKSNLDKLDTEQLQASVDLLWQTYQQQGIMYFIGNGGSASTASHMANDFNKGILGHKGDAPWGPFKAISLTDNVALMTAWANDTGYENIFSETLSTLINQNDCLVAISGSGNSPNIIKAVKVAKEKQVKVIGLTGFDGGELKKLSDVCIWVQEHHYGRVEDIHLIWDHLVTGYLFNRCKKTLERVPESAK